jgi:hypothetical protein
MSEVVFEKELPGGSKYEILESVGFSGHTELAIRVGGKIASILTIEQKRTGNLVCKPAEARRTFIEIRPENETRRPSGPPSLNDVLNKDPKPEDGLQPDSQES